MRSRLGILGLLLAVAFSAPALAQNYPSRPIVYVVPYTSGGITDNFARVLAKSMSERLGQPVVVENKPGAAGIVGTEYVAHAKPDGYTILYGAAGPLASHPYLYKKLNYDPFKSFALVHAVTSSPLIMIARPEAPFNNVPEFIAYALKNPGKMNYASSGIGSTQHLLMSLLEKETGAQVVHVPYKGTAPALADLLAGNVDVMLDYAVVARPQLEGRKVKALGITSAERFEGLSDIPTFAEQGQPKIVISSWSSIVAPAGTPANVVDKLAKVIGECLNEPGLRKYLTENGSTPLPGVTGEKFAEFLKAENVKWKELVEKSGAVAE